MNLPNGHVLQEGKYQITHVIGQGGFGITYKGVWFTEVRGALGTVKTEVPICIKEYFFKDYCYRETGSFAVKVHSDTGKVLFDKFKEKLIKEAKILSEVHHPYIVNVLEVFEENSTAYIAMEYISGCSLKYMLDTEGILPEAKVLRYVHQIGEALRFVHDKNILHLDIKPSNILIDPMGKARVIDFGVSKRYDIEQQETSTTMLTLSKGFASIEQYDNEGIQSFSPCPDVYSLGATMYNLLTGKIPTESILRATRSLQQPTELNPEITAKTESAIIKAMQIIPSDRFQSIPEMLSSLDLPAEEEAKNELSASGLQDDEETTVLSTMSSLPENEDERTIVNNPAGAVVSESKKKKKKKGVLISVVIAIFACVGSAVAFLVQGNKPITNDLDQTNVVELADSTALKSVPEPVQEVQAEVIPVQPEVKKETVAGQKVTEKKEEVKPATAVDKVTIKPTQPSVEDIDVQYATLVSSGKAKIGNADFAGAKEDFLKAKKLKFTEEVYLLIGECDKKQLLAKKAQYEEKKTFGKLTIVRKKSNQLYGAIDANAEERIPCKYPYVDGNASKGYTFTREDGLFDIYNAEGVLVNKGSTSYD